MTKHIEFSDSFRRQRYVLTILCGLLLLTVLLSSAVLGKEKDIMALRLGGCGGVYFYASAGELWVEVEKQDLNIRSTLRTVKLNHFRKDKKHYYIDNSVSNGLHD